MPNERVDSQRIDAGPRCHTDGVHSGLCSSSGVAGREWFSEVHTHTFGARLSPGTQVYDKKIDVRPPQEPGEERFKPKPETAAAYVLLSPSSSRYGCVQLTWPDEPL